MTKAQFIRDNNGKTFKRTVIKGATIEDTDAMHAKLVAMATEQGMTIIDNGNVWAVADNGQETGQLFFKPRIERETTAIMEFKSSFTMFAGGRGDLPTASEIDGDAFTKDYGNVALRFELVK